MSPRTQQTIRRIKKRSLPELLVHKFLTEYGYDHGPVIARAIVDDILATIQECYPERVPPQTVVWLAVRRERPGRRKGLDVSDLIAVRLRMVVDEETQILIDPQHKRERWAYHAFNQARYVRWCHEAYEQGGVLTNLDLSLLSGKSTSAIAQSLRKYEAATGAVVPTRGTVHDMGPGVTHKAEVIRRWLQHESPVRIARALNHSQDSVDRYIADYQKVRTLAQKFPTTELSALTGVAPSVVQQYLDLLRVYEPGLALYQPPPAEPNTLEEQPSSACGQCGQACPSAVHTAHRQPSHLSVGH